MPCARTSLAAAAALTALLVVVGCASDDDAACNTNSDCPQDQICVYDVCAPPDLVDGMIDEGLAGAGGLSGEEGGAGGAGGAKKSGIK
jgi:hypothetical protein